MANQPGSSQPNFDFQNFAKQLENSITKALKDAFKKADIGELGSKIKNSFTDVDLDQMLNTQTSITSIRKLKDNIRQIQEIQKVGGVEAYNRIQEEGKLREFWEKSNGKLADDEFARRLNSYRNQQSQLKAAEEQLATAEQIRNVQKDYEKITSRLSSKTKDLMMNIKGALSSPKAMAGAATVALEKIGNSFSTAFKQMKSEGLSTTQAISEYFNSLKDGAILFSKEVREAQKGFRETGGTLSEAREFGKEAAQAAAKYGGSMEQAGKALGTFQKLPGISKEAAIAANDFSGALAQAADVPADIVMKEVANNADAVALAGAKNITNLQKAVVNSAKLGVEFGKIVSLSRGLLDFENSINAQMEASVLLGKEINLDKAREAALQGDYLAVQREVLKSVGSETEFNRMNVLQKEKLAQAMGLQVSDLAKIVKGQGQDTEMAKEAAKARGESAGYMDQLTNFALENAGALVSSIPSMLLQTGQLFTQLSIMRSMKKLTGDSGGGGGFMSRLFGKGGGGPTPPGTDSVSKINTSALLKGAGAMAIASVGIFIFAKAVQELAKVEDWGRVAIGLGLFVGSMLLLSLVGPVAAGALYTLSPALIAFGAGVLLMGAGVAIAAAGLALFMTALTTVPINNLLAVGPAFAGIGVGILAVAGAAALLPAASIGFGLFFGVLALGSVAVAMVAMSVEKMASSSQGLTEAGTALVGMGAGLASVAANGLKAMPVLGALMALATVAPALSGLADLFGGGGGGGEKDPLLEELKELRKDLKTPVAINIDGKKLSEFIRLASNTTSFV